MKQNVFQILLIILFHGLLTNAQSCEPFVVENDTTILFNVTTSGSCWCDNYIGNGGQLLLTQNANLLDTIQNLTNIIIGLQNSLAVIQQKLSKVTFDDNTNTMYLTGANFNILSGSNATNGSVNGLGNIIVGYNENDLNSARNGSHNIIVGNNHGYTSYGGIVGGIGNTISGNYSFAVGQSNIASGYTSSVSGGNTNTASAQCSSISGGYNHTASGTQSSISGGESNIASGISSSVSGGQFNIASYYESSVSGGLLNTSSGSKSSVSGGQYNTASGSESSVSGGYGNTASSVYSSVCGCSS